MLLRIEVAAFHPTTPQPTLHSTEVAVPVRALAGHALAADSSLWPCSSASPSGTRVSLGSPDGH